LRRVNMRKVRSFVFGVLLGLCALGVLAATPQKAGAYPYYWGPYGAYSYYPPYYWAGNYYANPYSYGWYYGRYYPWANRYYYWYRSYPYWGW
jgi:hypothetical protein